MEQNRQKRMTNRHNWKRRMALLTVLCMVCSSAATPVTAENNQMENQSENVESESMESAQGDELIQNENADDIDIFEQRPRLENDEKKEEKNDIAKEFSAQVSTEQRSSKTYTVKGDYHGEYVPVTEKQVTFWAQNEGGAETEVSWKDLKPGVHYRLETSVEGFETKTDQFVTPSEEDGVLLAELGEAVVPQLRTEQALQGYCGGTLNLPKVTGEYYPGFSWEWKCVNEQDAEKTLTVKDGKIQLAGAVEGTYILTYEHGSVRSNALKITVSRLKLSMDWSQWKKVERAYDGTNVIRAEIPLTSDMIVVEHDGEYAVSKNDTVTLTGTVSSSAVGDYDAIHITGVAVSDSGKYDITGIRKTVMDKTQEIGKGNISISKAVVTVTQFSNVYFQNRAQKVYYLKNVKRIQLDAGGLSVDNDILKQELLDNMGEITVLDKNDRTYYAEGVAYDKESEECYVETDNIRYVFAKNLYDIVADENGVMPVFYGETAADMIKDVSLLENGQLHIEQGEKERKNGDWCSSTELTMRLDETSDYYQNDGYHAVKFLPCAERIENIDDAYIMKEAGRVQKEALTAVEPLNGEAWYEVLFISTDEDTPAVAAFLHILPEKTYSSDKQIDQYAGYPVITLFCDDTAPEAVFEKDLQNYDAGTRQEDSHFEQVSFTVDNEGFPIASVEYAFVRVNGRDGLTKDSLSLSVKDYQMLPKQMEEQAYTVNTPTIDGDYVLFVRTSNTDGKEGVYCSGQFFVDRTAPDICSDYVKVDDNDNVTGAITQGKEVYSNQAIHAVYTIKEDHLKDVAVTIKALERDEDGNEQEIAGLKQRLEQEAENLEKKLAKEQTAAFDFVECGNYTVTITAWDKAGQKAVRIHQFTVDTERPNKGVVRAEGSYHGIRDNGKKGTVYLILEKLQEEWTQFMDKIGYDVFSEEEIRLTIDGSDRITPVRIYYYISDSAKNEAELNALGEQEWTEYRKEGGSQPVVTVNRQKILYAKVVDMAGNTAYFSSDGMITDNQAPVVTLNIESRENANHFYNGDVTFSADIEDIPLENGAVSSGLQYIAYQIEKDGTEIQNKVVYDAGENRASLKKEYHLDSVVIPASEFNSNNVVLHLTAVDYAGNKADIRKELKIDNVKPEITVTYDDKTKETYYSHARTATVSIRERNLNTDDVLLEVSSTGGKKPSIGKWTHSEDVGRSDDAVYTCQVTFSEDDEYKISVSCVDQAGNKAVREVADEFTIDMTKPVIAVSYDTGKLENGQFCNQVVTATVTITEHNFNPAKVSIETPAQGDGTPHVSGFTDNGDEHTATVRYDVDGTYGLHVGYSDEAGNAADDYEGNQFIVDLTKPEVEISNVRDHSANKGEVAPVISCTDNNYDKNMVSVKVTGANSGELDLETVDYSVTDMLNGQRFSMQFPETEIMDDLYTLTVSMKDKAGNQTEKSIDFSVNRYGSVYTLATESEEWLDNGNCVYINEGKPIVLIETNVDSVVEEALSYTSGGVDASVTKIHRIDECSQEEQAQQAYYEVSDISGKNGWCQRRIEISAGNFQQEGKYTIQIDSTDKAGNHMGNMNSRKGNSQLDVEFAIDQTAPSVVVTGIDENEIYNEEKHTVFVDVQDNMALKDITIYLNDEVYGTYKAEEIAQMEQGLIPVEVKESVSAQKLSVKALDLAGNVLGEQAEGAYDAVFEPYEIFVTRNAWIRFLHTTWLVVTSVLLAGGGILGAFVVVRRKKK